MTTLLLNNLSLRQCKSFAISLSSIYKTFLICSSASFCFYNYTLCNQYIMLAIIYNIIMATMCTMHLFLISLTFYDYCSVFFSVFLRQCFAAITAIDQHNKCVYTITIFYQVALVSTVFVFSQCYSI